jgi:Mg2+ and Co2+ transporter CorA
MIEELDLLEEKVIQLMRALEAKPKVIDQREVKSLREENRKLKKKIKSVKGRIERMIKKIERIEGKVE